MPRRPKGFDPLASLFESSGADAGIDEVPLLDAEQAGAFRPAIEMTDPFFSAPEDGPQAPARRIIGPRSAAGRARHLTSGDPDITSPEDLPAAVPIAPAAPTLPPPAAGPVGEPAGPPLPCAAPPPTDPVALARALARAAAAKAGPPVPPRARAPAPAAPSAPAGPQAPASPAPPTHPLSRVEALSQRAVRPRTAQELIRQAQEEEQSDARRAEERRREVVQAQAAQPGTSRPAVVHKVQRLLEHKLRGLGPITVNNCLVLDDREILRALWRAHRARFGAEGKLDQVVATAAVLDALDLVPEGMLVAAHVLTDASDYLVWLDMREGTPLAAFADARAYFVGSQGKA